MDAEEKLLRDAEKLSAYASVTSGDDLWFLDVLIDIQVDGKLTFGEIGFMIHNALEDQRNEA